MTKRTSKWVLSGIGAAAAFSLVAMFALRFAQSPEWNTVTGRCGDKVYLLHYGYEWGKPKYLVIERFPIEAPETSHLVHERFCGAGKFSQRIAGDSYPGQHHTVYEIFDGEAARAYELPLDSFPFHTLIAQAPSIWNIQSVRAISKGKFSILPATTDCTRADP